MSETNHAAPLPKPRLILRLGGLGNRKFGRENESGHDEAPEPLRAAAVAACNAVLQEIAAGLAAIHADDQSATTVFPPPDGGGYWWASRLGGLFGRADRWRRLARTGEASSVFSPERPELVVLTGDAIGGDRIIAEAARGQTAVAVQHWRIAPDEVANVGADGLSVGTIPASGQRPADRAPGREEARALAEAVRSRAYGFRAQAEALRHHADLLLAVWDPDAEGKAGGTSESVLLALRERMPVIAVRLRGDGPADIDVLQSAEDLQQARGEAGAWQEPLAEVLDRLLRFPDARPHRHGHGHGHGRGTSYHPRVAYAEFLAGAGQVRPWPGLVWEIFDQGIRGRLQWEKLQKSWLPGLFSEAELAGAGASSGASKPPERGSFEFHFGPAKDRASQVSAVFGNAHRGGIVVSYLLAVVAVLLALGGSLLHGIADHQCAPQQSPVLGWVMVAVAAAEVVTIVLLLALALVSKLEGWQEAYTDTRILAEALRAMKYLGPLGVHTPLPKLPAYLGRDASQTPVQELWSVWYFRALVRQAPLRLDRAAGDARPLREVLATDWIGDPTTPKPASQIAYHRANVVAQQALHDGGERLTGRCLAVVFVAACGHLIEMVWHAVSEPGHGHGVVLPVVALGLCVGGPALIAACHGLLSQIDTVRLRQRSESMDEILAEHHRALQLVGGGAGAGSAEAVWGLAVQGLAVGSLMMDETADWSLIYRNTDIRA